MREAGTIRLLVLDASPNGTEQQANTLRNAGLAVRATRVATREALLQALEQPPWDLLLVRHPGAAGIAAPEALQLVQERGLDMATLVLARTPDAETLLECLRAGAAAVLDPEQPEQLQLVANRELAVLRAHRAQQRCAAEQQAAEQRCRRLLESSRDAIGYVREGVHLYANQAYAELFGYTEPGTLDGLPMMEIVARNDHERMREFLRQLAPPSAQEGVFEFRGLREDGSELPVTLEFAPVSIEGEPCTQLIIRGNTADAALARELETSRHRDALTGLSNRAQLLAQMQPAASRQAEAALTFLELDNFSAIKKLVGFAGSDALLCEVAARLQARIPPEALLARCSDDSFALLLIDGGVDAAAAIGEELRQTLELAVVEVAGHSLTPRCSVGVAPVAGDAEASLNAGYQACAQAHALGGNRVHRFQPTGGGPAVGRAETSMVLRLRHALAEEGLALVFQPIVNLRGEGEECYEVLLRMSDSEGELLPATEFLPAASSAGLMGEIDRWVIERAVKMLANQQRGGFSTSFFIILSDASLQDPGFTQWLSELLAQTRVKGQSLVFQVRDSEARAMLAHAKRLADQLRALDCRLAVTQFGTEANSLALLRHLQVDFIKVDPSFTRQLAANEALQSKLRDLVQGVHEYCQQVVAPSVEDATSVAALWRCGVSHTQGYYLQEPGEWLTYDFPRTAE